MGSDSLQERTDLAGVEYLQNTDLEFSGQLQFGGGDVRGLLSNDRRLLLGTGEVACQYGVLIGPLRIMQHAILDSIGSIFPKCLD